MKNYVKEIYTEKTKNVDPGTNTDLANSLELLSSGIYTEEERFIFELLQNAVDAYSNENHGEQLNVRIVIQNGYVVFMHNGDKFSKRDIEGICSVGNGNKSTDIKKIGYKGIGFKSVFMHSNQVIIKTGNSIFGFSKEHWADFFKKEKKSESGRIYKMPWQIIPIALEQTPIDIDTKGFNVVTFIKTNATNSLSNKIKSLMSDCQFLLFLRHSNIYIEKLF